MTHNHYIYIAVMALVSYAIRILPLTLIRKPIKNRFIQSFLYYVPDVYKRQVRHLAAAYARPQGPEPFGLLAVGHYRNKGCG